MTVSELIKELQKMPQDMPVGITYFYGDRHDTEVVEKINFLMKATTKKSYLGLMELTDGSDYDTVVIGRG